MADAEIAVVLKLIADQFQSQIKESESSLGGFFSGSAGKAAGFATAISGVGFALAAIARESGKAVEELDQLSEKTGVATQTFQEWSVVMAESTMTPEVMATGIKFLSKAMMEFQQGEGKGFEIFKALGMDPTSINEAKGMTGVLDAVREKMSGFAAGDKKLDIFAGLFGKGGMAWMPMMAKTQEEFDAAIQKAYELGAVLGGDTTNKILKVDDAFDRSNVAVKAFKENLTGVLASMGLTTFLDTLNAGIGDLNNFIQNPLRMLEIKLIHISIGFQEAALSVNEGLKKMMFQGDQEAYFAKMDALEAKKASLLAIAKVDDKREIPKTDMRPSAPEIAKQLTGVGDKAVLKTQEEELKAELEGYKFFSKEKEQIVQARILTENLDERHAVVERLAIRRDETASQVLAIQKMLPLLEVAHQKELQAAGGVAEKKLAADENYKQKYVKYTADIQKLLDQGVIDEGEAANKILALNNKKQETLGKMMVDYYKQLEDLRQKNLKDEETTAASLVTIGDMQLLGSVEMATRKIALIRAQIEKLKAEVPSAERDTKLAEKDVELGQQTEIQSNSFVAGWARGMKQFTRDSTGAFGQAQIMARDTAQKMQSGFESLFFDAMQNKFHSLKDVATSVFTFMQQLAAKTMAQYATVQMMGGEGAMGGGGGLLGMMGGLFGKTGGDVATSGAGSWTESMGSLGPVATMAEGGFVRYFGRGGPVGTDTVPAWLTPGEGVLSNKGMAALGRLNAGGGGGTVVHMTINTPDANSFRHSSDQIMAQAQVAMGRAQRNM